MLRTVFALFLLHFALPAMSQEPVTECDQLAAGAFDDGRVSEPTRLEDMDPKTALPACRAAVAAEPNNLRLQYQLARALEVDGNDPEAFAAYLAAAEAGYPAAMNGVGRFYLKGRAAAVDVDAALSWYGKAALLGDVAAMQNLGDLYENGTDGVRKDPATAYLWYRMAADRGYSVAEAEVGFAYAMGHGVPLDMDQALLWFEKAAAQNEPSALYNLGYMHERGIGVDADIARAARYYVDFVKLGYVNALENFADSPSSMPADLWLEVEKLVGVTPDGEPDAETIAALATAGGFDADGMAARFEAAMAAAE